jgi:hypothetical protein
MPVFQPTLVLPPEFMLTSKLEVDPKSLRLANGLLELLVEVLSMKCGLPLKV